MAAAKKKKPSNVNNANNEVLIEPISRSYDDGFPTYYPPSRHLKAAQAATTIQDSIYPSTSKSDRAKTAIPKKLTAAEVQQYLVSKGYLDSNVIVSDNWEDPYTTLDKWRFHDAWRRDGTARKAINILAAFVLGRRTKHSLDTNTDFPTKEEADTALEKVSNNSTYQDYKHQLDKFDRDCNFDKNINAAFIQAKVFGRAVLIIQDDPVTGLPIALKLCSSMRLGRVFIDELRWKIVAVEYLDYEGYDSIIPAQKMIYFANLDYGVSPYTQGFGYSDYEPVVDISETNRQIWSVAIKEINKSYWAPFLVIKYLTKKRSLMQKVASSVVPGAPFVHNQDLTFQQIKMDHDLMKLLDEVVLNDKKEARDLGVPSMLIGHEAVTNRATTGAVIDAWDKSVLEKERTWLRGIIEPQWIDRNLAIITNQPQDIIVDLEFKIKMDYDPIPLDTSFEIVQAVDVIVKDGVIDTTKARELLKFEDIEERMQEKEQQEQQQKQQNMKMMAEAKANQPQMIGGPQSAPTPKAPAENQVGQV